MRMSCDQGLKWSVINYVGCVCGTADSHGALTHDGGRADATDIVTTANQITSRLLTCYAMLV